MYPQEGRGVKGALLWASLLVPDDLYVFSVLALAVSPLAVHDGRVNVGWGEGVGFVQQRDHAQEDGSERDVYERESER